MRRTDIDQGRLVYTCNCGWIDRSHANPTTPGSPYSGTKRLWDQLLAERVPAIVVDNSSPKRNPYGVPPQEAFKFPNGREGFLATYEQRAKTEFMNMPVKMKDQRTYVVSRGLTMEQKQSVALAIVMSVSHGFESLQSQWPANTTTNSGYSVEDLVSDLISFYKAVDPVRVGVIDHRVPSICAPCQHKSESYKVYDRNYQNPADRADHGKPWDQIKNRAFYPKLSTAAGDVCRGRVCRFPMEFQRIRPAKYGELFRLWRPSLSRDFGYEVGVPVVGDVSVPEFVRKGLGKLFG